MSAAEELLPSDPSRPPLSSRRFAFWGIALCLYTPLLLVLDRRDLLVQLALGASTAAFLLGVAYRSSVGGKQLGVALAIATAGEIFFSLIWGCYDYRLGTVPPYVPFGHGVFYVLACETARRKWFERHEKPIVRAILLCGWIYALFSLAWFRDAWGFLWWCLLAWFVAVAPTRRVLCACIVYTIALEWLGTSLGNWRWAERVPYLGIPSGNPPCGVGLGYAVLDFTTLLFTAVLTQRQAISVSRS